MIFTMNTMMIRLTAHMEMHSKAPIMLRPFDTPFYQSAAREGNHYVRRREVQNTSVG